MKILYEKFIPESEESDESTILFYDYGEIIFSAYSYEISSSGQGSLSSKETKELYLVMKEYYEGLNK